MGPFLVNKSKWKILINGIPYGVQKSINQMGKPSAAENW
jgi:hypothetical protein